MDSTAMVRLKLAHLNDTHSHFDPSRILFEVEEQGVRVPLELDTGGFERIATVLKEERQQATAAQQTFLLLHAGDSFQGSLYFNYYKGLANADLLNALRPDAMTLGNHEFDLDHNLLADFIDEAQFPILASNLELTADDPLRAAQQNGQLHTYLPNDETGILIREIDSVRVALIGLISEQTPEIATPETGTIFHPAIEQCKRLVKYLQQQGIVHIIALTHLGIDHDRRLAEQVPELSLIVGAHSHTLQGDFRSLGLPFASDYAEQICGVPILHAGKHAETLGIADIELDNKGRVHSLQGGNYFLLSKTPEAFCTQSMADTTIHNALQHVIHHPQVRCISDCAFVKSLLDTRYRPHLQRLHQEIVCELPEPIRHSRLPHSELPHGSEIAPLVAAAFLEVARNQHPWVDFAIHNAGGVRCSLGSGPLSRSDILGRLLPFAIPLVIYPILGDDLISLLGSVLDNATDNDCIGTGGGSFPYVADLKFHYHRHASKGERIHDLCIRNRLGLWEPIQATKRYHGVSSAYTASGKEGYAQLIQKEMLSSHQILDLTLGEAFIHYATSRPRLKKNQESLVQIYDNPPSGKVA